MKKSYILAAGSICLGLVCAYGISALMSQNATQREVEAHSFASSTSNFERGEYYFNVQSGGQSYDRNQARYYYQRAIREGEEHELLWYQLGRLDFLDGDYISAIERFNKQIELHGDAVPNVYYSLGLVYGFKAETTKLDEDLQAAVDNFKTFLTYAPDSPWTRTDLAWILFQMGEFEEMIPILETGLETHPDQPWLLNMYGLALMNTGQSELAAVAFEQSLTGAKELTVEEWGQAYTGNHPDTWEAALDQFVLAIEKNQELNNARLAGEPVRERE